MRGFRFLSPSRRACEVGFSAFEKIKCIFSIAPVGILGKSRECFSLRNTHRTQCAEAPDARDRHPVCSQCFALLGLSTGCTAPDVGYFLLARPVLPGFLRRFWLRAPDAQSASGGVSPVCEQFATLSAHESGEPRPVL